MLGGFHAPALLVVGMDVLVPAHRIFQPLFPREAQRRFDLRADVRLADTAVEIGHEDDGGNLLEQRAVFGFKVRRGRPRQGRLTAPESAAGFSVWIAEDARQAPAGLPRASCSIRPALQSPPHSGSLLELAIPELGLLPAASRLTPLRLRFRASGSSDAELRDWTGCLPGGARPAPY